MTNDGRIRADSEQAAALRYAGALTDCPTLRQAIITWRRLPKDLQAKTSIAVMGAEYHADQIERLDFGPTRATWRRPGEHG
jgi:hypothetical protein